MDAVDRPRYMHAWYVRNRDQQLKASSIAYRKRRAALTPEALAALRTKNAIRMRAYYAANSEKCKAANKKLAAKRKAEGRNKFRRDGSHYGTGIIPLWPMSTHCEICRRLPSAKKRICLDHCHLTGKFRGWLCDSCNRALGLFQDNPAVLIAAATYLRKAYGR
jgi:Recombination endonuclease VII